MKQAIEKHTCPCVLLVESDQSASRTRSLAQDHVSDTAFCCCPSARVPSVLAFNVTTTGFAECVYQGGSFDFYLNSAPSECRWSRPLPSPRTIRVQTPSVGSVKRHAVCLIDDVTAGKTIPHSTSDRRGATHLNGLNRLGRIPSDEWPKVYTGPSRSPFLSSVPGGRRFRSIRSNKS